MFSRFLAPAVTMALVAAYPAVCGAQDKGAAAKADAVVEAAHDKAEASHDSHGGHEAHVHIGAEGVSKDPADFKTDLAIWTVVVFLVLLGVLRKFAWGPITAGLDKRERVVAEHIAVAEHSEAPAKRLLAEYEAKLLSAQDQVRAIMEEARRHAEQTTQEILAKARADAATEMERAKHEIGVAKDQALTALAQSAADHAVELAGKILGAKLNAADHRSLIESSLAGFAKEGVHRN
jgi:F-type H+-transporting ATPase subunit b